MTKKLPLVAALAAALTIPATGFAADTFEEAVKEANLELGLGVVFKDTAYRDYDDTTNVIPIVSFSTKWFYADAGEFGFKPWENESNRIGIFLTLSEEEWDSSDNDEDDFDDFKDKDKAAHLGVSYRYMAKWGMIKAQYFADISDEHDGTGGSLMYAYPWKLNEQLTLIPSVKFKYMDEDYANYYYGIDSRDAATRFNVDAYDTGSANKYSAGLAAGYQVTEHWKMLAAFAYTALDDDLKDSRLTEDDYETSFMIGTAYKF